MTGPSLIPPPELLFDGASSAEEFISVGEGFTRVFLVARGGLRPHERVLDLGSGNGQKARVLTGILDPAKGSYEGLDIVAAGIEWCREQYRGFPHFRFTLAEDLYSSHYTPNGTVRADEYRLPYEDSEFDLVFCASLFTHLLPHETAHYLEEISRVLKPRGRCIFTAFILNSDTLPNVESGSITFPIERKGHRLAKAENPSWAVAIDELSLRKAVQAAGLRICEVTYGFWSGAPDLLRALQDCIIAVKR